MYHPYPFIHHHNIVTLHRRLETVVYNMEKFEFLSLWTTHDWILFLYVAVLIVICCTTFHVNVDLNFLTAAVAVWGYISLCRHHAATHHTDYVGIIRILSFYSILHFTVAPVWVVVITLLCRSVYLHFFNTTLPNCRGRQFFPGGEGKYY